MMKLVVFVEFRVPPGTVEDRQAGIETGSQYETAAFPSSVPWLLLQRLWSLGHQSILMEELS